MRLTDLNPRWVGAGGPGITDAQDRPVPARHGVGLSFTCPCGKCDSDTARCYVPFKNPLDGGPELEPGRVDSWQRTGDTFENLTLTPSILRNPAKGGCGWHGYITNGQIVNA